MILKHFYELTDAGKQTENWSKQTNKQTNKQADARGEPGGDSWTIMSLTREEKKKEGGKRFF